MKSLQRFVPLYFETVRNWLSERVETRPIKNRSLPSGTAGELSTREPHVASCRAAPGTTLVSRRSYDSLTEVIWHRRPKSFAAWRPCGPTVL